MGSSVASACVVAVAHPKFDERPVAVVVLDKGVETVTRKEVHEHLQKDGRFTKWQWPDDVLIWKEIPMTGTGKMDKKTVRAMMKATLQKNEEDSVPCPQHLTKLES